MHLVFASLASARLFCPTGAFTWETTSYFASIKLKLISRPTIRLRRLLEVSTLTFITVSWHLITHPLDPCLGSGWFQLAKSLAKAALFMRFLVQNLYHSLIIRSFKAVQSSCSWAVTIFCSIVSQRTQSRFTSSTVRMFYRASRALQALLITMLNCWPTALTSVWFFTQNLTHGIKASLNLSCSSTL